MQPPVTYQHPQWGTIGINPDYHIAAILTPCCGASAKGSVMSSTGVCCRACYRELPEWAGMAWDTRTAEWAAVLKEAHRG